MSQDFFDNHITICSTTIYPWDGGISFTIYYKVKIEWVEYRLFDQFPIYITSNLYPGLNVPRDSLLSKYQIDTVLSGSYFGAQLNTVAPVSNLKYSSAKDAMSALIKAANVDTFCIGSVSIPQKNYNIGHPYFKASGVLSWNENRCIEGSIDLITGETNVSQGFCYIEFCFLKGTQVTKPDGTTISIENVKSGERILSFNTNTMKSVEDIVLKVDSVIHNDLVTISFNDKTINKSTSDHPYFVKGKGWCSLKPIETFKKYNIRTAQIQIGDTCFKYFNNLLKEVIVKSISVNVLPVMTYNISSLKKNHCFFANGILVSNESN